MKKTLLLSGCLMAVAIMASTSNALAALQVNVMPSGVNSKVNTWDSGPYTWAGNNLELWGNVTDTSGSAKTYTWKFGDGSSDATGTVSDVRNIAVNHVYASPGSYIATLTVKNTTTNETDTDTVYIDVVTAPTSASDAVSVNLAVQRGLKYLYMTRGEWNINGCNTYYWDNTRWTGDTGLAVLAFEDHGHREMNDPNKDIYAATVSKGLQSIFAMLRSTGASNSPNSSSDLNSNGRGLYEVYSGGTMYEQGILSMAIANTATPAATATCGTSGHNVTGQAYRAILEDLVDYTAIAQEERNYCSGYGGWRYSANYCSSDNSVSQWPALGLAAAAGAPWNISSDNNVDYPNYPDWVKTLMPNWLNYSQNANGAFGYTYSGEWLNIAKTGSGIIAMSFAGIGGSKMTNAINYIGTNWGTTSYDYGNIGDHYAMYAVKKGLQYAGVATVGGHDWQKEYNAWYVNNMANYGTNGAYWPGSVRIGTGHTSTAFALLVMAPGLVELPPVAEAGGNLDVPWHTNITFDGSASHHADPARHIVKYEWDFNYDGLGFDVDATGAAPTKVGGYDLPSGVDTKNYTVALRVTDDNSPALKATDTMIVTVSNGNVAPVANPGGPYLGAVGSDIVLDGRNSKDANACPVGSGPSCLGDSIVKYQWDLDGDGLYGTQDSPAEPEGAVVSVNFGSFQGTKPVALKVTDSFGKSAAQSVNATTVAISDLFPASYTLVSNTLNRVTGKTTVVWKMSIKNRGNAGATMVTAKWTPSSIPVGVTVNDSTLGWAGSIDAGETQISDSNPTFSYTYPQNGSVNLSGITWDIEFTDGLGTRRIIRNVPQK